MNDGPEEAAARAQRIELSGDLDRRSAECLALEIRALAKRYGLEIRAVKFVTSSPETLES